MTKYKAIETFDDDGIIYHVGDEYPESGKADKSKVNSFLSDNNTFKRPIIEEVANEETIDGYDY